MLHIKLRLSWNTTHTYTSDTVSLCLDRQCEIWYCFWYCCCRCFHMEWETGLNYRETSELDNNKL